jgi:DNA polymerase I-like protein with 3'-5' exonuclease and polymerase domains
METHPFSNTRNQTLVAYYASAELNCFNALGWEWKGEILDLYTEFRNFSNGVTHPFGRSIIGALKYFGLPSIESAHKDEMRALAMRGGPFTDNEKKSLLEYCQSDVDSLEPLLAALFPSLEMPRALMRGKYNIPISIMETRGTPIDYELYQDLCNYWDKIKDQLIKQVDKDFGVYINSTFKEELFEAYLSKNNIRWERLPSGRLKLDEETFKAMSKIYPEIIPLRHLRDSLAKLRLNALQVGSDGRNRCLLSPFSSITGRNQPSTTKFIFGLSKWARGLIQPKPGMALAYIDWSQQEFGIAAALSGDQNMKDAYTSGDPYLAFAKQAHAVPQDATKQSHTSERDQYKQCVLATQYGMGADALAVRLKQPVIRARQLLTMHRKVYRKFWDWSDNTFNVTVQANKISTLCGWNLNVEADLNPRSLRNFPMQANAAELLRVACILMADRKIQLCAPIHDAVLIEAPEDKIEEKVKEAQACMEEASQFILSGFKLSSEAEIFRYPDRFLDDSAKKFWEQVMEILKQVKQ